MARYLVKDKYTYEKIRQTDYSYRAGNWVMSQNHVDGRLIFDTAEPICTLTLKTGSDPVEVLLTPEQGQRFSEVSGFMISQKTGEGMLCRVTLWGKEGESFCSVCYMTEAPRLFATSKMTFTPVRMTLDTAPFDPKWDVPEVEVSLNYGYALDNLGR